MPNKLSTVLIAATLIIVSPGLQASEARFLGPAAIKQDQRQQNMIANSIEALVQDCTVATKIDPKDIVHVGRGPAPGRARNRYNKSGCQAVG